MAILNFDASKVDPQDSFDPVPLGEYKAIIESSEMKPTKNNAGSYLQLTFKIIDGDYKNRLIFDRLNLNNQNQTTVEIAQRALSAICHAVNVLHPKDSAELHNKPLIIKVGIRKGTGDYSDQNEIKGYKSINGGSTLSDKPKKQAKKEDEPMVHNAESSEEVESGDMPWET